MNNERKMMKRERSRERVREWAYESEERDSPSSLRPRIKKPATRPLLKNTPHPSHPKEKKSRERILFFGDQISDTGIHTMIMKNFLFHAVLMGHPWNISKRLEASRGGRINFYFF